MKSMVKNSEHKIDTALVIAYQSGHQKAFATLVERWHLQFCKFAYWYVKDADVAKDITQESWTIIYKKLNTLEQPGKFKSWAISIVNRKAIDWIRTVNLEQKKRGAYYDENSDSRVFSEENNDQSHIRLLLKKEIEKLPSHQKIVLQLFYTEAYSLKQISDLLDISVGTVKSRLFHAREKLKSTVQR